MASARHPKRARGPEVPAGGSRLIADIEARLGWKLAPEQRAEALERAADGESAVALADWYQRLEAARTEINDPLVRCCESPPSRAEGSDPRRAAAADGTAHYKP